MSTKEKSPNAWLTHVQDVRAKHPDLSYKEILVKAKGSYTPVKKAKSPRSEPSKETKAEEKKETKMEEKVLKSPKKSSKSKVIEEAKKVIEEVKEAPKEVKTLSTKEIAQSAIKAFTESPRGKVAKEKREKLLEQLPEGMLDEVKRVLSRHDIKSSKDLDTLEKSEKISSLLKDLGKTFEYHLVSGGSKTDGIYKVLMRKLGVKDLDKLYPGEMHMPLINKETKEVHAASFAGPGTKVTKRIENEDKPKQWSAVDKISELHDLRYSLAKTTSDIRKADKEMLKLLGMKNLHDAPPNILAALKAIKTKYTAETLSGVLFPSKDTLNKNDAKNKDILDRLDVVLKAIAAGDYLTTDRTV